MAAKSPTMSVKSREMIGVDQFSQRREVFDKHDTVFLPPASPTNLVPSYKEVEPIITSNHGKTTTNFKRNTPGYSSMRESRTDERDFEFRPRKYSDNFTSELNQSDDVEYRHTMTDRTRRLSKLRRDFMTSNLHDPSTNSPFNRSGIRASMPVNSTPVKYKIENLNLYKFPFAEPYSTPTPVRRVVLDLGPSESNGVEGNQNPETTKHLSLTNNNESPTKIDQQKLFEELLKRYSPQRKPIDWQLPPTKPRVVASVPKSSSSVADSIDSADKKINDDKTEDDVFEKKEEVEPVPSVVNENSVETHSDGPEKKPEEIKTEIVENGIDSLSAAGVSNENDSKSSQIELEEKQDQVPELSNIQRQISRESTKKKPIEVDLRIPELIEKMTAEGENLENNKKPKKVKRKRSFLDKLLGRKKDK
ncbi:unnamed protein product [Arctia plantaginis]|uniref:Uncharacterized protein n=1 Tax=Arctia plantaginis TaxID=874455 RepID=A0A8S0ZW77_ARCPL|nr:unnamed protein product [Arctia plantaginis]CAB3238331.1 unnamed protein product [Arctia plantaginis]